MSIFFEEVTKFDSERQHRRAIQSACSRLQQPLRPPTVLEAHATRELGAVPSWPERSALAEWMLLSALYSIGTCHLPAYKLADLHHLQSPRQHRLVSTFAGRVLMNSYASNYDKRLQKTEKSIGRMLDLGALGPGQVEIKHSVGSKSVFPLAKQRYLLFTYG